MILFRILFRHLTAAVSVGMVHQGNDPVSDAYERTSLIVTTNLPFENWTEVLGSERLTGATLDRLTHRCHILEASGESYRLKDAQRRQARKPSQSCAKKSGASSLNPKA